MILLRIARLAPDDPAYSAGGRWALFGLPGLEREPLVGVKVVNLEAALDLARCAAQLPNLHRLAGICVCRGSAAPLPVWEALYAVLRRRRDEGHQPQPPAQWADIFHEDLAPHRNVDDR